MATPTESRPSANGELADRVQQLRLDNQLGTGKSTGSGGSWLPWVLCGLLAITWVGVGVRWYKTAPQKGEDAPSSTATDLRAYQAAQNNLKRTEDQLRRRRPGSQETGRDPRR